MSDPAMKECVIDFCREDAAYDVWLVFHPSKKNRRRMDRYRPIRLPMKADDESVGVCHYHRGACNAGNFLTDTGWNSLMAAFDEQGLVRPVRKFTVVDFEKRVDPKPATKESP